MLRDEHVFIALVDVFEDVERVGGVERRRDRPREHVVHATFEAPTALPSRRSRRRRTPDRCRSRPASRLPVCTTRLAHPSPHTDFEDARLAAEHLGDELVAREHDAEPLRIGVPRGVGAKTEACEPLRIAQRHVRLILRLVGLVRHPVSPSSAARGPPRRAGRWRSPRSPRSSVNSCVTSPSSVILPACIRRT